MRCMISKTIFYNGRKQFFHTKKHNCDFIHYLFTLLFLSLTKHTDYQSLQLRTLINTKSKSTMIHYRIFTYSYCTIDEI